MANPLDHLKSKNFPAGKTLHPRDADRLLDIKAVSEWLGVSTSTLAKWRLRGTGPPFLKVGKRILMRQSDLDHWLDCRRRLSTSDDGNDVGEF